MLRSRLIKYPVFFASIYLLLIAATLVPPPSFLGSLNLKLQALFVFAALLGLYALRRQRLIELEEERLRNRGIFEKAWDSVCDWLDEEDEEAAGPPQKQGWFDFILRNGAKLALALKFFGL